MDSSKSSRQTRFSTAPLEVISSRAYSRLPAGITSILVMTEKSTRLDELTAAQPVTCASRSAAFSTSVRGFRSPRRSVSSITRRS